MATCPNCRGYELRHTLLVENLPAYGCPNCDGLLLSLVIYRHWRETESPRIDSEESIQTLESVADTTEAISCPKCRALMTKFRIAADIPNRLDYCAHCDDLWFDACEWAQVASIAKSGRLAEIIGRPWQRKIRRDITDQMEANRMQELLGTDYPMFAKFHDWFRSHPQKYRLLAFLSRKRG